MHRPARPSTEPADLAVRNPAAPTARSAADRGAAASFRSDERGVTSLLWAGTLTTFLLVTALAIDYAIAVTEQEREQYAVDAAALAGSQYVGDPEHVTRVPETVEAIYNANRSAQGGSTLRSKSYDPSTGEVIANAGATLKTYLLRFRGKDEIKVSARTRVVRGAGSVEIAMVLDNSGSMGGSSGSVNGTYIEDLKVAATNLAGAMFTGTDGTEKVKVGLVPFAASVNVDPANRTANWIDGQGQSSIHGENFSETASRFDLFDQMGVAWKGCVETRPGALDTSDDEPNVNVPNTLFVPMFAPDEPDDSNADAAGYANYPNNYISDFGGTCPAPAQVCTKFSKKKNACTAYGPEPLGVEAAQARTCKYKDATPSADSGPNAGCTTAPILPLNSTKQDVLDAISAMRASGNTNVGEGVMWGVRVLSPGEPFTEGRPSGEVDNRKFMIVMTDGENFLSSNSNHNKSVYAAHGYAAKGRLGTTYSQSAYTTHLNNKLVAACALAKQKGITVFTVAFRLEDNPDTQALLKTCATTQDQAFRAGDGDALLQSFQNIGRQISQLRIAE